MKKKEVSAPGIDFSRFDFFIFITQVQTPVTLCSGELWSILVVRLAHSADLRSRLRHVSSAPCVIRTCFLFIDGIVPKTQCVYMSCVCWGGGGGRGLVRITSWNPISMQAIFACHPARSTGIDWTASQNRVNYDVFAQAPSRGSRSGLADQGNGFLGYILFETRTGDEKDDNDSLQRFGVLHLLQREK